MNNRLLSALQGRNEGRPPLWMMRQAGRCQPSYLALREKYSLETLFRTPELITRVTLAPVSEFHLDAAILFADILTPLESLGFSVTFPPGKGPQVSPSIADTRAMERVVFSGVDSLAHVGEAIVAISKELEVPFIGFAGGPFTVASYVLGGVSEVKRWYYSEPAALHRFLEKITEATIAYLHMQIRSGVQVVQLFDSWAGMLAEEALEALSLRYLKQIISALPDIPTIVFSRNSALFAERFAETGADCISVDWLLPMSEMRRRLPGKALQGNLDPDILCGSKAHIFDEVSKMLSAMEGDCGYICNLGHGLHPRIPYENVQYFCELVTNWPSVALSRG